MKISTRRLILRPIAFDDADAMHEYMSDERAAVPGGFLPSCDAARTRKFVRRAAAAWRKPGFHRKDFSIIGKREKAWLGAVGLRWPHDGVGELGYGLLPRHWGEGYATEAVKRIVAFAFDECGAHRVQATCWVKNAASARVLAKAGLKKEGRLRGYLKRGNAVRDEFMFGLSRAQRRGR